MQIEKLLLLKISFKKLQTLKKVHNSRALFSCGIVLRKGEFFRNRVIFFILFSLTSSYALVSRRKRQRLENFAWARWDKMINSPVQKIQHANVLAGYFRIERSWNDLLVAWGIIRRRTKVGVSKFFKRPFLSTPFKIIRILSRTCTACVAWFFQLYWSTSIVNSLPKQRPLVRMFIPDWIPPFLDL